MYDRVYEVLSAGRLSGKISKEKFKEIFKDELYEGVAAYAKGHVGSIRKGLNDAEKYSAHGSITYTTDVVDVILCAAANAIKANVGIFQNIGGKAVVIFNYCTKPPTDRNIYLKFDYYPGNPSKNHYSSIVVDNKQNGSTHGQM